MIRHPASLIVAALALCASGTAFRAEAGEDPRLHPYYCMTRTLRAESDWGKIVNQEKSDPPSADAEQICPDPCYPDCIDPSQIWEYCYTGFCPAALPAPGNGVHLAMVSGAWQVEYAGWEIDMGFGDRRPLNLLSRAWRSPDGKTARVFLPSNQQFADFTQTEGDAYILNEKPSMLPPGTTLTFAAGNAAATMAMSDGQRWEFGAAGQHADGGALFRKTLAVERQGWTTRYEYGDGMVKITDAAGHPYEIHFGEDKRITRIAVAGRDWRYEYGANTVKEIEPSGASVSVAVGAAYRFAGIDRDGGALGGRRTTRIDINDDGFVTAAWDGDRRIGVTETREGDVWNITVEKDGVKTGMRRAPGGRAWAVNGNEGRATSGTSWATAYDFGERVDALGRVTRKEHNANGKVTLEVTAAGVETRHAYDDRGNRILTLSPEGAWRYEYDADNYLTKETSPAGAVTQYEYDKATGKPSQVTDALGNITKYTYDARGLTLSAIGPFKPGEVEPAARKFEYDAWGNMTASFDEAGHATRFEYDLANNLTKQTDALGNATQFFYDGLGHKIKEIDALGGTTEWVYDDRGLVVEVKGSQTGIAGPMAGRTTCSSCGGAAGAFDNPGKYEYNAARLLTKFTDVEGHATIYEYNDLGQQVKVTNALGAATLYEYDLEGNLLATTDPLGAVTRQEYDALGRMTARIDPLGRTTRYEYDAEGRPVSVTAPDGATTRSEYDPLGRLSKTIAPNGAETTLEYNPAGQLSRSTDASGLVTEYTHNANHALVQRVDDATGERLVTRNEFSAAGRLVATTDPMGHTRRFEYDPMNRLIRSISPVGRASQYEYDALGRRNRTTLPNGRVQATEFAPGGGEVAAILRGDGIAVQWFEYDTLGRRVNAQGLDAATTEFVYDAAGRVIETRSAGVTLRYIYDAVGRMVEQINPAGQSTRYEYDLAGQIIALTDPSGAVTRFEYDVAGRPTRTTLPGGEVRENVYDALGQLVESRGGPAGTKRYEYDALGRQMAIIDANGRATRFEYDRHGRMIRQTDALDQAITFEYNAIGRRTALIDANGNRTTWEYDADGMMTAMIHPNGDREEYVFDGAGDLLEQRTPNGEVLKFTYNEAGALLRVDVQGNVDSVNALYADLRARAGQAGLQVEPDDPMARDFSVVYTRDGQQRVLTETGPFTTMRYAYTPHGQLAAVTDTALNKTLRYEYDDLGQRTRMVFDFPGDPARPKPIVYQYDAAGRITHTGYEGEALTAFTYDDAGRRATLAYPNGVATQYGYDAQGRLQTLTTRAAGDPAAALAGYTYRFDNAGNVLEKRTETGTVTAYEYDNAYRLTREIAKATDGAVILDQAFAYDPAGNRLRHTRNGDVIEYTYNAANQLLGEKRIPTALTDAGWREKRYTYDKSGNRVLAEIVGANGTVTDAELFTFDALNRIMSMTLPNESASFTYRGTGYEHWRATRQIPGGQSHASHFVFDGADVAAELSGTDAQTVPATLQSFLTPTLDQTLASHDSATGTSTYYSTDRLTSATLSTNANGEAVQRTDYAAFGDAQNPANVPAADAPAAAISTSWLTPGFTGRNLKVGDYTNNRMRWQKDGRWLSRDPIGHAGGANLYEYVKSSPHAMTDPYGLWGPDEHGGLTGDLAQRAGFNCPGHVAMAAWSVDYDDTSPDQFIPSFDAIMNPVSNLYKLWRDDPAMLALAAYIGKYHFPRDPDGVVNPDSTASRWLLDKGLANCDLFEFGRGLHVYQDSWSHQGTPALKGLIGHGRGWDYDRWPALQDAIRAGGMAPPGWRFVFGFFVYHGSTLSKEYITGMSAALSGSADDVMLWPATARAMGLGTYDRLLDFLKKAETDDKCACACQESFKMPTSTAPAYAYGRYLKTKIREPEDRDTDINPYLQLLYPGDDIYP